MLTKGPVWVDGERITEPRSLGHGCRITVPGLELTVEAESSEAEETHGPSWVIERDGGAAFGVGEAGLSMGGAGEDDIRVPGWSPRALHFYVHSGRLSVECRVPIEIDGQGIAAGSLEPLDRGSRIRCEERSMRVLAGSTPTREQTTHREDAGLHPTLPAKVLLTFLPRGGRLELWIAGTEHAVVLSERRCELVACLLRPAKPYVAGDLVDDESLGARLWPTLAVARTHINVLVHRLRRDLAAAGLDGARLVVRAKKGHATRFALAPGAVVHVE